MSARDLERRRPSGAGQNEGPLKTGPKVELNPSLLKPTPENWLIYRRPEETPYEFADLKATIKANGVTDPILVSKDLYIISGHRRHQAAVELGLETVPVMTVEAVVMTELAMSERIKLLAEFNKGTRVKSSAENIAESMAAVDSDEAVRAATPWLVASNGVLCSILNDHSGNYDVWRPIARFIRERKAIDSRFKHKSYHRHFPPLCGLFHRSKRL